MRHLSKKEIKKFLELYPVDFITKKSVVTENDGMLFVDNKVAFKKYRDEWIPSLELLKSQNLLPVIIVDKGTPPFIAKGADLMRPGVVSCDQFEKGSIVVLKDEIHNFPIATGEALFTNNELMSLDKGKVVRIIHNLSD